MLEILPEKLKELAAACPFPLYVVGGTCREYLSSSFPLKPDYDICAPVEPEVMAAVAEEAGYKKCAVYKNTGTVKIKGHGEEYEFTSFRSDKYVRGTHTPAKIYLTEDMNLDARRRDFACNAVYFDVLAGQTLDPLGGIRDIEEGVLRTVRDADIVMAEDPVRILRLARFAAGLGFSADAAAKTACVKYVDSIDGLSAERKRREWDGLMRGRYLRNGLDTAFETGILAKLFPALADNAGLEQPSSQHRYDALEHAFVCAEAAPDGLKTAALLHDEGKAEAMRREEARWQALWWRPRSSSPKAFRLISWTTARS